MGVRRIARHARKRRALGVDGRREAHRKKRRAWASTTSILDPTNLWLTIHESIGHPTELDRAVGQEANYAGTSFIAPPEKTIGKLRYGPEFMNVQADRTQEGSLSRVAWDDEGVAADQWLIVERGIFKDYQTTREQAKWIQSLTGVNRSHGCSFAESWNAVQFQRMPNISLLPGERDITLDDIVAATNRGIVIRNRGLVVDRSSTFQFPVLGAGVLRGAERQDCGNAAGRRLSEQYAGVLELAGHDRRQVVVLARGDVQ